MKAHTACAMNAGDEISVERLIDYAVRDPLQGLPGRTRDSRIRSLRKTDALKDQKPDSERPEVRKQGLKKYRPAGESGGLFYLKSLRQAMAIVFLGRLL